MFLLFLMIVAVIILVIRYCLIALTHLGKYSLGCGAFIILVFAIMALISLFMGLVGFLL